MNKSVKKNKAMFKGKKIPIKSYIVPGGRNRIFNDEQETKLNETANCFYRRGS
jgi:hypothetical protein